MGEIMFRAKPKEDIEKSWVYGGIVHQTDYYGDKCDRWFIIDGTETNDYDIGPEYEVIPETVGRFTGLVDKNGVKIFTGDIVKSWVDDYTIGVICFGKYRFQDSIETHMGFYIDWIGQCEGVWRKDILYWTELRELSVVGNVHDNPDLFEVSE